MSVITRLARSTYTECLEVIEDLEEVLEKQKVEIKEFEFKMKQYLQIIADKTAERDHFAEALHNQTKEYEGPLKDAN